MANKMISEIQRATTVGPDDLIVVDQADGTTKSVALGEISAYFKQGT